MNRTLLLILAALAFLLASCGGNSSGTLDTLPDSQHSGDAALPVIDLTAGLPPLSELAEANRDVSILGPGWYRVTPFLPSGFNMVSGFVPLGDDGVTLSSIASPSYALYGVNGFDGDSFPTSIRTEVENLTHEYYVIAANYPAGRWDYIGPFTGSAEVMLPTDNEGGLGGTYVNEYNNFWFGIVIGPQPDLLDPGKVDILGLEVGVHGGNNGPGPALFFGDAGVGSLNAVNLSWIHSADSTRPDFAGYLLERAPAAFGSYTRLNQEPVTGSNYFDDGLEEDTTYRYRIAAVDVSGNMSIWVPGLAITEGAPIIPIVVCDMPNGPFYGRASIAVDLTGSFDPEGEDIVGWSYIPFGIEQEPIVDGQGTINLNPGCYLLNFSIETQDGRFGSATKLVKVFPEWEDEASVIPDLFDDESTFLENMRMAIEPGSGDAVLFGSAPGFNSFQFWREVGNGFELVAELPVYTSLNGISDLVAVGGSMACAVNWGEGDIYYAVLTGDEAEWIEGPSIGGSAGSGYGSTLVSTGDDALLFMSFDNDPDLDLHVASMSKPGKSTLLLAGEGDTRLRSCYSAANGEVYLMRYRIGVMHLTVVDAATLMEKDSFVIYDTTPSENNFFGCAIDPDSGLPLFMWKEAADGPYFSRSLTDATLGTFSAVVRIDPLSNDDYDSASFAGGPDNVYAFFAGDDGVSDGQARLYEFDNDSWSVRNTVSYSDDSAYSTALAIRSNGNAVVADHITNYSIVLAELATGGSDSVTDSIAALRNAPRDLGAVASDTIHVAWNDRSIGYGSRGMRSLDGGGIWVEDEITLFGYSNAQFGKTVSGELYSSIHLGTQARLFYWNNGAGMWEEELSQTIPPGGQPRTSLLRDSLNQDMIWSVWDHDSEETTFYSGGRDTGVPANDYTESIVMRDANPVHQGGVMEFGFGSLYSFQYAGDPSPEESPLLIYDGTDPESDILANPLSAQVPLRTSDDTIGRSLAAVSYLGSTLFILETSVLCTHGNAGYPFRNDFRFLSNDQLVNYENWPFVEINKDPRRTVSSAEAHGATGLLLTSAWDGSRHQLQWSNFGEWEDLPMPDTGDRMFLNELAVDNFGNWYMFYFDRDTLELKVIKTKSL